MTNSRSVRGALYLLIAIAGGHADFLFAQDAPAVPADTDSLEVRVGAMRSSNVLRTPSDETDGTLSTVGLGVNASRKGRRFDASALGDLDWLRYPSNTFGNELTGYFDGKARYQIVPATLLWKAEDTYGQLVTDPFAASTPDNRVGMNYFSTGPELNMPLGNAIRLKVNLDYMMVNYESPSIDSDGYDAGVALVRDLSASNSFSLNATTQRTTYDDEASTHYDVRQVFIGYAVRGRRTTLNAEVGYSVLDRQGGNSSGTLIRADAQRHISSSMTLSLFAAQQFSDSGDLFRGQVEQRASSTPLIGLAVSDAFKDKSIGAGWNFEKRRTRMGISGSRHQEEYSRSITNDRTVDRYDAYFERRLRPRVALNLAGYRQKEGFDNTVFESTETGAGAGLEWSFSRHIGAALRYDWIERTSSDPTLEYVERRVGIRVYYRPIGR